MNEKRSLRSLSRGTPWRVTLLFAAALVSHTPFSATAVPASSSEQQNSCESCHANRDFRVTNRKLYDYYEEWSGSVHRQEQVTCDDCHGGEASATNKDVAHGDGVSASDPNSGVYYKNVPDTCGTCHDEIFDGFRKSDHFKQVEKQEDGKQGPTCVTCHGAINSEILNVNSVAKTCEYCHNEETDNHPENPAKAEAILNRSLSIHRFYRYISIHAEPEEASAFFRMLDPKVQRLSMSWHTFDLKKIEQETREVMSLLTGKRDEIRARRKRAGGKGAN